MKPTAIISDLDGTLLNSHERLSSYTVNTLRYARELGIPLIIATGRPVRLLEVIEELRDLQPFVIASNGAMEWDHAQDKVLDRIDIDADAATSMAATLRQRVPNIQFIVEYGETWGAEEGSLPSLARTPHRSGTLEELLSEPAVKVLARSAHVSSKDLAAMTKSIVGDELEVTWSTTQLPGLAEIHAPGVSKGNTLERLGNRIGIDLAGAVAFGDMPNDLSMLSCVGHPYVMSNAVGLDVPQAIQARHHHEDGVAHALVELISLDGDIAGSR